MTKHAALMCLSLFAGPRDCDELTTRTVDDASFDPEGIEVVRGGVFVGSLSRGGVWQVGARGEVHALFDDRRFWREHDRGSVGIHI